MKRTTSIMSSPPPRRQQGIVLVVGLVFLLVLTIIGVTSLRTTTLQERMAGNLQQRTVAFQDAEARISRLIDSLNATSINLSTNDTCDETNIDPDTNPDSVNANAVSSYYTCPEYLGSATVGRLTDSAEGAQTSLLHFRIKSKSTTVGNATVTVQQGVYQRGPNASPGILQE